MFDCVGLLGQTVSESRRSYGKRSGANRTATVLQEGEFVVMKIGVLRTAL